MRFSTSLSIVAAIALGSVSVGHGQGTSDAPSNDVSQAVAASLYDRGMVLFEQGDIANAKKMFSESLGRSPDGSSSANALRMLRQCNEKLGVQDLDSGRPGDKTDGPLDPYGDPDGPLDPYGDTGNSTTLDPYGDEDKFQDGPGDELEGRDKVSRTDRFFITHGAVQGFTLGMAVVGPFEEDLEGNSSLQGGAVLLGLLGAGASGYLAYWLSEKKSLTQTQGNVINSGGLWGLYNGAHLGNVLAGENSDGNDIYKGAAISGLIGTGVGYWYAKNRDPSAGAVAFTNSLTLYGTSAGLLLGVAMDPPRGDAYSLNALLGSATGLGLGYYAKGYNPSRRRMLKVDLGAAVGALAPWVLIYPFLSSEGNADVQWSGFLSAAGLGAGAYFTWRYTDSDTAKAGQEPPPAQASLASPALLQRQEGQWSLSSPIIRPMAMPALLPQQGLSLGTDLISGRF